jgi:predicted nucleotidyltransferase
MKMKEEFKINYPEKDFLTVCILPGGSHLYGTNNEYSDIDVSGVFLPPRKYILGILNNINDLKKQKDNLDLNYYSLERFFILCWNNNPNILEYLFISEEMQFQSSIIWKIILENREFFLSKKIRHTFYGYIISQLKRLKTHHEWITNPPDHQPTRKEFGLNEYRSEITQEETKAFNQLISKYLKHVGKHHLLRKELEEMNEKINYHTILIQQPKFEKDIYKILNRDISDSFIEILEQEHKYRQAKIKWSQYQNWLKTRNPKRSRIEEKFGYDCKNAMHIFRLFDQCKELLTTHKLTFPRPNAEELIEINNGKLKYDDIMGKIENIDNELQKLYYQSNLPKKANRSKLNQLYIDIMKLYL